MSETEEPHGTRRDFLYYATAGAGVVATGAAVWPLVNQMNPSADVQAQSSIRVDISGVEEGTQLTVKFLGKPVFIRRRTAKEIQEARAVPLDQLPDQNAENMNLPNEATAIDQNRTMDKDGKWLVMIGVCTHLGCVPLGNNAGEYRRLVLPLPRLAVRYRRPHPQGSGPAQPRNPGRQVRWRHDDRPWLREADQCPEIRTI